MRSLLSIVSLVFLVGLVVAGCGDSRKITLSSEIAQNYSASVPVTTTLAFGTYGGTLAPLRVTIKPTGRVRWSGTTLRLRRRLSQAKVVSLSRLVRAGFAAGLRSRQCPGVNPDFARHFVRAMGRVVTVHGNCEPRFNRLWITLARAVGLIRV
jgi:hypothetical protein